MFLYVIAYSDSGPCKIGYASNATKRLRTMQTGCPLELKIRSMWVHDKLSAKHLEQHIHGFLKPLRIRGEWYKTTPAEIATIISAIPGATQHTEKRQSLWALRQAALYHPRA